MSIAKFAIFNKGKANEFTVELTQHPTEQVKGWFFQKELAGVDPGKTGREVRKNLEAEGITMRSILATVKETEKAKQVVLLGRFHGVPDETGTPKDTYQVAWVPKSAIEPQDALLPMIRESVGSSGA